MVDIDPLATGIEVGGGGILGFLMGYTTKKIIKVIMILIGLQLAVMKFLETRGIISVDWSSIASTAGNVTEQGAEAGSEAGGLITSIASTLPVGAGFTAGAYLGFRRA